MTHEDAIRHIECVAKNAIEGGYDSAFCSAKALILVAELLKAEPCGDAVSREYLLNHLNADCVYVGDRFIEFIKGLPPVTPKQKWISVDYDRYPETYPKAFQEVWITDAYGEVYHKAYDGTRGIKAWMPYVPPEPYKEGGR